MECSQSRAPIPLCPCHRLVHPHPDYSLMTWNRITDHDLRCCRNHYITLEMLASIQQGRISSMKVHWYHNGWELCSTILAEDIRLFVVVVESRRSSGRCNWTAAILGAQLIVLINVFNYTNVWLGHSIPDIHYIGSTCRPSAALQDISKC